MIVDILTKNVNGSKLKFIIIYFIFILFIIIFIIIILFNYLIT